MNGQQLCKYKWWPTLHNQLKVSSHTGCPGIPIGGSAGVGIRVIVPGVADDQVATDKVDISWK